MGDVSFLGAVVRRVEDTEYNGQKARAVVASAAYPTNIEDLWDAITNPERIPRWFSPVTGDFKQGGNYQVQGNAGGTILECEPPRTFVLTWEMGADITWVRVTLTAISEEGCSLRLEHIAPVTEDGEKFWTQFGPGAVGVGWDLSLLGLHQMLRDGQKMHGSDDPEILGSEIGKSWVNTSSDGWKKANLDYGADEAKAEESRVATTNFYTGMGD
ncbi:MAG: polyketide cyclase [Ponticaulis sp.]|nr:polyketide cyclase [Ponticaulis sp.]